MTYPVKSPRKLIEVALPLNAINEACAYEKMPGIGAHPRGLHLWWARRPLAAARAVIFAQLVNDPGFQQGGGFKYGKNKKDASLERKRLFKIIEDLVKWENTTNEEVLEQARVEIRRSWREVCELNRDHPDASALFNPEKLPGLHDPFAGGGAIPLEAQRLGLEAYASDLNPLAAVINKAMIEVPPRFSGRSPVGPHDGALGLRRSWPSTSGLAEDVRRYGRWIRDEAQRRIGTHYPAARISTELAKNRADLKGLAGKEFPVIAWLWARTTKSPNPAFAHVDVPLVSTFVLSNKKGKEAYVQPIVSGDTYRFTVKSVEGGDFDAAEFERAGRGTKAGKAQDFLCLLSGSPISREVIREVGKAQQLDVRLLAIVADGTRSRLYLPPDDSHERAALALVSDPLVADARESFLSGATPTRAMITGGVCSAYGLATWGHLFTPRQLIALTTVSDLVGEARSKIERDALAAGVTDDRRKLDGAGDGATAYAEAVSVYLAFAVDRCADFSNSVTRWVPGNQKVMNLFAKQAIPMTWDYPEAAILADTVGGFAPAAEYIADCIEMLAPQGHGVASQADAQTQVISRGKVVSTDPPYYDNIGYADLSDFFYPWLRRSLRDVFPSTLATISTPKAEELVATTFRHGSKEKAEQFFLDGMTRVIHNLSELVHPEGPVTIYYAHKQAETNDSAGTSSTGWDTFLTAVLRAGFAIVGTWPLRSEQEFRMVGMGVNALASSIVLVCRKRSTAAPKASRREFLKELNAVLPGALDEMTRGADDERSPVAPVDLSQAIIGPGMAVFSKYSAVLEADGAPMSVRTALQLINRFLAEDDFDPDTQFCLRWFEQNGWTAGRFGDADTLSRAKGTSVDGVKSAGVVDSGGGAVRLLKWSEYDRKWDPRTDARNPVWETLHHLVRALKQDGESGAGQLLAAVKDKGEPARQLAYRLYTLCERQGWSEEARVYNEIITSWSGIEAAASMAPTEPVQGKLFD